MTHSGIPFLIVPPSPVRVRRVSFSDHSQSSSTENLSVTTLPRWVGSPWNLLICSIPPPAIQISASVSLWTGRRRRRRLRLRMERREARLQPVDPLRRNGVPGASVRPAFRCSPNPFQPSNILLIRHSPCNINFELLAV